MNILGVAIEDIDFEQPTPPNQSTNTSYLRSGWARYAMNGGDNYYQFTSKPFPGGAVTSLWISARIYWYTYGMPASLRVFGCGKSGTTCGLWIVSAANTQRLRLTKFDGTTSTTLQEETGTSMLSPMMHKVDIKITSFSDTVNGNVKVYVDGAITPCIDYTGNLTLTGFTSIDCLKLSGYNSYNATWLSEMWAADDDTRIYGVATLAPSAAGDTNNWTGAYTDIDENACADSDFVYTNANDQECILNCTNSPSGSYSVLGIVISARAAKSLDATPTKLKLGARSASTTDLDSGQTLVPTYNTYHRIAHTINGSALTTALLDAIQIAMKSAA